MASVLASHPVAPGSIPGVHNVFSKINYLVVKIVDVGRLINTTAT